MAEIKWVLAHTAHNLRFGPLRPARMLSLDWFKKLPGYQRSPSGLEWRLWKRLPAAFAWGTALPVMAGLIYWFFGQPAEPTWVEESAAMLTIYKLIGLLIFIWSLLLTVAIGCVLVMVMKGPTYVADAYQGPPADPPA